MMNVAVERDAKTKILNYWRIGICVRQIQVNTGKLVHNVVVILFGSDSYQSMHWF